MTKHFKCKGFGTEKLETSLQIGTENWKDKNLIFVDQIQSENEKGIAHLVQIVQSSLGLILPPFSSNPSSARFSRCFGKGTIPKT